MKHIPVMAFAPDRFIPITGTLKVQDTHTNKKITFNQMCLIAQKSIGVGSELSSEIRALKTVISQQRSEIMRQRVKYNTQFEIELDKRKVISERELKEEIACLQLELKSMGQLLRATL